MASATDPPRGWTSRLDDAFYPNVQGNWDDALFATLVRGRVTRGGAILDLGAGAGIIPHLDFRDHASQIVGVDPDPRVAENPYLTRAHVGMGESIPEADASFDAIVSANVLEHLADPLPTFREVHRLLRPGGVFLAKTPNRVHYVTLGARLTPLWFHRYFNRLRGRRSVDTFPTVYLANSPKQIRALARESGFEVEEIRLVEGRPEYLRIHPLLYLFGIAYERLVNRFEALSRFRVLLVIVLRKPGGRRQ